jgi:hypothetical protein
MLNCRSSHRYLKQSSDVNIRPESSSRHLVSLSLVGGTQMPDTSAVTYLRELTEPSDDQVATWRMLMSAGERFPTLIGDCPTCRHRCEISVTDEVVQGGAPAAAAATSPPALTRLLTCNCRVDHQQPAGVRAGCGRYWLATLTLEENGSYRLSAEKNLRMLPATEALSQALATQDSRIQGAAEKWIGAVTAIYGLFSLTGIATGKDALSGLSVASKSAVAAVLAVGIAAAGSALIFGYQAAYGWPRTVDVSDNQKLQAWYKRSRNYATIAAHRLQWAIYLAFISLAAIAVVMILVWFLPRK